MHMAMATASAGKQVEEGRERAARPTRAPHAHPEGQALAGVQHDDSVVESRAVVARQLVRHLHYPRLEPDRYAAGLQARQRVAAERAVEAVEQLVARLQQSHVDLQRA